MKKKPLQKNSILQPFHLNSSTHHHERTLPSIKQLCVAERPNPARRQQKEKSPHLQPYPPCSPQTIVLNTVHSNDRFEDLLTDFKLSLNFFFTQFGTPRVQLQVVLDFWRKNLLKVMIGLFKLELLDKCFIYRSISKDGSRPHPIL